MLGRVVCLVAAALLLLVVWLLLGAPTDPQAPGTPAASVSGASPSVPLPFHARGPDPKRDARAPDLDPPTREELDQDPWLGASISGRIVTLDGSPVEDVPVTVRLSGYSIWMNELLPETGDRIARLATRTDKDGGFTLRDLPMQVTLSLHVEGGVLHPLSEYVEIQGAAWTHFRVDDRRPLRIGDLIMLPDPAEDGPPEPPSLPISAVRPTRKNGDAPSAPLRGVAGRIVARDGMGIRRARVRLRMPMNLSNDPRVGLARGAYNLAQGVTDDDGHFRIVGADIPAEIALLLNVDGPRHAAAYFDLSPLAIDEVRDLDLAVDEAARVSVTALGLDGAPVADASVVVWNADGFLRCRPTDLDGHASFSNLPPGIVRLSLHAALDLASAWSADARPWNAPLPPGTRELQLAAGELGEIELRAADASLASLSAVAYLDGEPARGAWIQLRRGGDWDREPIYQRVSPDGSFRTSLLPAGDLRVQLYAQLSGDTIGLDLVPLKAGEHTTVAYDLRPASLSVEVRDRSGAPAEASVRLNGVIQTSPGSNGSAQMTLREDTTNGRTMFRRLPPGTWTVEADPKGKDNSANKTASVVLTASRRETLVLVVE